MYQFQTIALQDLGQGIDQLSSEDQIGQGFSEDLLNADPRPEGYLSKRVGYQGYAGQLPLRVSRVERLSSANDYNLCFYFDSAVNLSRVRSSPLVVYGRLSENPPRIEIASVDVGTDVITTTAAHGLTVGKKLQFETTGALPDGLSVGTEYYVITAAGSTLKVSLTLGGPSVNIGSAGTGTHSILSSDFVGDSVDTARYYPDFTSDVRQAVNVGSDLTLTLDQDQHGLDTENIWVGFAQSDSVTDNSNTLVFPDKIEVDSSAPHDIVVTYTNGDSSFSRAFVYPVAKDLSSGSVYYEDFPIRLSVPVTADDSTDYVTAASDTYNVGDVVFFTATAFPGGLSENTPYWIVTDNGSGGYQVSTSFGGSPIDITSVGSGVAMHSGFYIGAAIHGLSTFNLIPKVFFDTGTSLVEHLGDKLFLEAGGTSYGFWVRDEDTDPPESAPAVLTARVYLSAAPIANVTTGTVDNATTSSIPISNLESPFIFPAIYLEPILGGTKELVLPDTFSVDALTNTATVTFTNNTGAAANFTIYWETAEIATNKVCVTSQQALNWATNIDENPQLTLWGLLHEEAYLDTSARQGWVNHLDSYRSTGEQRLVAGLGGNIFSAQAYATAAADYLYPAGYPSLRSRANSTVVIGPAFVGSASSRTRGYVQVTGASDGFVQATATAYQATGTYAGYVRYTVQTPGRVISDTLTDVITPDSDYLTVQQAGYSQNAGTFLIKGVETNGTDELYIYVKNSLITDSDWDESDAGMEVGVFTDEVVLNATSEFIPGDRVLSDNFTSDLELRVVSSSGTTLVLSGCVEPITVSFGLRLVGERTSCILPMRNLTEVRTVDNFVRGDMLSYTGIDRLLKVRHVNTQADISVTITVSSGIATATLASGSTAGIALGQRVLLTQAGAFSGVHTVASVPSLTSFTFETEETAGGSGTLLGKTICVDEAFTWQDTVDSSVLLLAPERWIPVEAPDDTWNQTADTYYRHFLTESYSNQPFLRSVMASDNLYLTNGIDRIQKYDGTSIYRAGLPRWQPHLFLSTTDGTGIEVASRTIPDASVLDRAGNFFKIDSEYQYTFPPGAQIVDKKDNTTYTVVDAVLDPTDSSGNHAFLYVDKPVTGSGSGDDLKERYIYRYYFRLNAVDRNNNILATAAAGSEDFRVELSATGTVHIKLVGLPTFDNFDYDRLEVEIYRTKANGVAPYYRIVTIPMAFDRAGGYIQFDDKYSDDTLRDLDVVHTVLMGQELGTRWQSPLKAKYVTSAGNRLILGNLKADPELNIHIERKNLDITAALLAGDIWTLRKDSNDTLSTTNMVDRVSYEWVDASDGTKVLTIDPTDDIDTTSGVSFTIDYTAHGADVGDWVYVFHSAAADGAQLDFCGWWQITAKTTDTFTVATPLAPGSVVDGPNRIAFATNKKNVPVVLGTDGNYGMLGGNPTTAFSYETPAFRRLANAINASMRQANPAIAGQEEFIPWVIANSGADFDVGQCLLTFPRDLVTIPEIKTPAFSDYRVFINDIERTASEDVGSFARLFPSRVLISYPNYAEIFDNPTATLDSDSDSAVDVNSADGQEITGIIPFFGDTAFGASLRGGVVVVFKTNSIYLVDVATKATGGNPVQKLESRGLGCTAPYSIAPAKDGIIFANESGIYKLTRQLTVEYVGRYMERKWLSEINRNQLELAQGHYYAIGNQYKLSLPLLGETKPSLAYVYNTVREYRSEAGMGSWTRYDNHPATAWANLGADAYFASTLGQVFSIRRTGTKSDYRDDSSAINMVATLRPFDFGDAGIRKVVGAAILYFRVDQEDDLGIDVFSTIDLAKDYQELDGFIIDAGDDEQDGMSDLGGYKVRGIKFSLSRRKCVYVQLRITNNAKDESVDLSKVAFRVAGLTDSGLVDARVTTKVSKVTLGS